MYRSIRLFAIAAVAAAFVPVAHAGVAPCGWVTATDDLGVPWITPSAETCPQAPDSDPQRATASASDATGIGVSPYNGWIIVTDDQGVQWLVPIANATPSTMVAPSERAVATDTKAHRGKPSTAKQRGFWGMRNRSHRRVVAPAPFITDNSPSQNRVAPRRVAVVRTLASTLRTFPG